MHDEKRNVSNENPLATTVNVKREISERPDTYIGQLVMLFCLQKNVRCCDDVVMMGGCEKHLKLF